MGILGNTLSLLGKGVQKTAKSLPMLAKSTCSIHVSVFANTWPNCPLLCTRLCLTPRFCMFGVKTALCKLSQAKDTVTQTQQFGF